MKKSGHLAEKIRDQGEKLRDVNWDTDKDKFYYVEYLEIRDPNSVQDRERGRTWLWNVILRLNKGQQSGSLCFSHAQPNSVT